MIFFSLEINVLQLKSIYWCVYIIFERASLVLAGLVLLKLNL